MAYIELKNITKRFGSKTVLDSLSFSFPSKGLFVIRGENGSGKSTLLSIVGGRDRDYEGELLLEGALVDKKTIDSYVSECVSFVPQDSLVFEDETVLNNIFILYSNHNKEKALNVLKEVGLENNVNQLSNSLSAGEKQRLSFARSLYGLKDILICDETTANLDVESRDILLQKRKEISRDHLVLFVTHDVLPEDFLQQAVLLERQEGKLVSSGPLMEDTEKTKASKNARLRNSVLYLFNQWKEDSKSHLIVSLVQTFFITCVVLFGSLFNSFQTISVGSYQNHDLEYVKYRQRDLWENAYLNSAPVFIVNDSSLNANPDGEKIGFYGSKFPNNGNYQLGSLGGLFSLPSQSFIDQEIHLTEGTLPTDENEIIISDFTRDYLKENGMNVSVLTSSDGTSYSVTGIYKGKDTVNIEGRLKARDSDSDNFPTDFYACFSFRSGSAFTYKSEDNIDVHAYLNTDNNRKIRSENKDFLNNLIFWRDYLLCDKDGKNVLDVFSSFSASAYLIFFISSYAAFSIAFALSYFVRNKRRFLLERYLGVSRKILFANNSILYGRDILFSLSAGSLLGAALASLFSFIGARSLLSPLTRPILIQYPMAFLYGGLCSLAAIGLLAFVFALLAPKDISKQIYEVKKK